MPGFKLSMSAQHVHNSTAIKYRSIYCYPQNFFNQLFVFLFPALLYSGYSPLGAWQKLRGEAYYIGCENRSGFNYMWVWPFC